MAAELVFLIGYRGTGKSLLAGLLATRLNWQALDADSLLEERVGRSVKQIFADEGEAGFRDREAALLAELCTKQCHVIATGGGIILREENRARLKAAGLCLWLQANPATIWQRLQADPRSDELRPNLAGGGLTEIEQLLQVRTPWYRECADLEVNTVDRTPAAIVDEMVAFLRTRI
ncbi:MAG: shikimate kinase [Gemmataceae bacterium]